MTTSRFVFLICTATALLTPGIAPAQQPTPLLTQPADKLIAVLTSPGSSQKDKIDACRQLAVISNAQAVPALVGLLPDDKLNHMARYALEGIPDPAVDEAFRNALGTLKGKPLVGVIGSVGVRKDPLAVHSLAPLLNDSDPEVAQAAARALGSIANGPAIELLQHALAKTELSRSLAIAEGLLRAAEAISKSNVRTATAIYDVLRADTQLPQVRAAGLRGAILVRGSTGTTLLRDALKSGDYATFAAAVRIAYQLPTAEVTRVLALELPHTTDNDRKLLLIEALGKRSDPTAVAALAAAAKDNPKTIQVAALRALAETGNPGSVPVLAERVGNADAEIAQAALEAMAGFNGREADSAVETLLRSKDAGQRLAAIELTGRRRMTACLPSLLTAATDADSRIRPAAIKQIGELGKAQQTDAVLDLLPKLKGPDDLEAAEQALVSLCGKADRPATCVSKVTQRLATAQSPQKSVLLAVLGSLETPEALQAVRNTLTDSNPDVHAAAVRALSAWKTADAAPDLFALAQKASNPTERSLALRSYFGIASDSDVPTDRRLRLCQEGARIVQSTDEKKMLLGALGTIDSPQALEVILPSLTDSETREEAAAAIVSIAEKLVQTNKATASGLKEPLEKAAQATSNAALTQRINALQGKLQKN